LLTPVRIFEGLALCLDGKDGIVVDALVGDFGAFRVELSPSITLALIDVTVGSDADEIRSIAVEYPDLKLVAIGLRECWDQVALCGQAGFTAYLSHHAPLEAYPGSGGRTFVDARRHRLRIDAGFIPVQGGASRRLNDNTMTKREGEVLRLLGRGFSKREIARELDLSVATVKHHVHSILGKLGVGRRTQAMRRCARRCGLREPCRLHHRRR